MKKLRLAILLIISLISIASFCACNEDPNFNTTKTFSVSHTQVTLEVGETLQLVAKRGKDKIQFASCDTEIVEVDEKGVIIAKKVGSTDIEITAGDEKRVCEVNVISSNYDVVIEITSNEVFVGATCIIRAKATKNGEEYSDDLTFAVDKIQGVSLNANGNTAIFSASEKGDYVITVTSDKGGVKTITLSVIDSLSDLN